MSSATTNPDPGVSAQAFIPLEANPELMTSLLHKLGLSGALQVHDVYSITEPELLAFIPRPALALLLVFPVSATYESARLAEDAGVADYAGKGDAEPVVWWKQTIRNACGLMGLLHAVANGPARGFIGMFFFFLFPFLHLSSLCPFIYDISGFRHLPTNSPLPHPLFFSLSNNLTSLLPKIQKKTRH
jgi:hypothetical protein